MMEQLSMFDYKETMSPLASRLRPESLETFVGQKHLLGKGKLLRQLIDQRPDPFHDLLGAARRREDHPGQHHRQTDQRRLS